MQTSKLKGLIWLCLGILLAGLLAVGLPYFVSKVPWRYEKKIGAKLTPFNEFKFAPDNVSLKKILKRIYPLMPGDNQFDVDIHIVLGKTVNAFAYLGGNIYIYEGLIKEAQSPEEIAGIIAHEIAHISHRDVLQGVAAKFMSVAALQMIFSAPSDASVQIMSFVLGMHFTRTQEAEADHDGLLRLQKANVDPHGLANFFKRIETSTPDFLSDHPNNSSRAEEAEKIKIEHPEPILSHDEWLSLHK